MKTNRNGLNKSRFDIMKMESRYQRLQENSTNADLQPSVEKSGATNKFEESFVEIILSSREAETHSYYWGYTTNNLYVYFKPFSETFFIVNFFEIYNIFLV